MHLEGDVDTRNICYHQWEIVGKKERLLVLK